MRTWHTDGSTFCTLIPDMMESLIDENPGLFYVDVVWLSLIAIAGVLGNSLALCAVATTPSLRTSTQLHITILAGMDLFITAVLVPCRIATEYHAGGWPRSEACCHALAYAAIFFIGFSLQQLVFLAQVRFLRVATSDKLYRRFTSKPAVVGQQVYAVLLTLILTLIPLYSKFGSVGYSPKLHFCIFTGRNQQVLAAISMLAALGMIPLFYGLTFLHVRNHRRKVDNWRGLNTGRNKPVNGDPRQPEDSRVRPETDGDTATRKRDIISETVLSVKGANTAAATSTGNTYPTCQTGVSLIGPDHASQRPHFEKDRIIITSIKLDQENGAMPSSYQPPTSTSEAPVSQPRDVPLKAAPRNHKRTGPTVESVKITRNLLLIFCAYLCCWLPWCIMSLIEPHVDIPTPVHHVLLNMLWTNSCINPYLYASMSRNYRNAFKKCMKLKCFSKR